MKFVCILYTIIRLPSKSSISTRKVFPLCQFWYVHILLYSNLVQWHSINLLLVSAEQKEQFSLIHCPFLCILNTISWLPYKSLISTWEVFSLCQFWYVHILLYSNLVQCHSINLLIVSAKQEEQFFLIHCPLLCILFIIIRLPPKIPISTRKVFSLCQFWYVHILL